MAKRWLWVVALAAGAVLLSGCASLRMTCQDKAGVDGSVRRKITYRTDEPSSESEKDLRAEFGINCLVLPDSRPGWLEKREEYSGDGDALSWSYDAYGEFRGDDLPPAVNYHSPGHGLAPGFDLVSSTRIELQDGVLRYTTALDHTSVTQAAARATARYLVELAKLDFSDIALPNGFEDALTARLAERWSGESSAGEDVVVSIKAALKDMGVDLPTDFDKRVAAVMEKLDEEADTPEGKLYKQALEDTHDIVATIVTFRPRFAFTTPWPITATNGKKTSKTGVVWDLSEMESTGLRIEMTAEARKPK